jgi:hypothetical protein
MSESISRRRFLVAGASVLAVGAAALVGGTYAKYTTSGVGSDSATVAKFGVTVTPSGSLFATTYATTDTTDTGITNSVSSSGNVVAPGTSGGPLTLSLSGTPEVAVRVTLALAGSGEDSSGPTDIYLGTTSDAQGAYHPLKYTLSVKTTADGVASPISATVNGSEKAAGDVSLVDLQEIVKAYKLEIGPNTDLSTYSYSLSWEWPFDDTSGSGSNDASDTALAGTVTDGQGSTKCDVKVTLTVTQID